MKIHKWVIHAGVIFVLFCDLTACSQAPSDIKTNSGKTGSKAKPVCPAYRTGRRQAK